MKEKNYSPKSKKPKLPTLIGEVKEKTKEMNDSHLEKLKVLIFYHKSYIDIFMLKF